MAQPLNDQLANAGRHLVIDHPAENVVRIRLNRPDKLNALSIAMIGALSEALALAAQDPEVHCVVLTGVGRAFSVGADLKEFMASGGAAYSDPDRIANWNSIQDFPKPLIAAVNGYAFGGGLELALLCDIIVAAEIATFATPEINVASFPGDGGTQRLPRLVGRPLAMRMILTGEPIDALTAERKGLVSDVVPDSMLEEKTMDLASAIARKPASVTVVAKRAVRAADALPLSDGLDLERRLVTEAFAVPDRQEGLSAFMEKRQPVFNRANGHQKEK